MRFIVFKSDPSLPGLGLPMKLGELARGALGVKLTVVYFSCLPCSWLQSRVVVTQFQDR